MIKTSLFLNQTHLTIKLKIKCIGKCRINASIIEFLLIIMACQIDKYKRGLCHEEKLLNL